MGAGRFHTMRVSVLSAMFLAALPGIAMAQPSLPPAPVTPVYPAPQQPPVATRPNGPTGPIVAPGMSGLYNVLTYGQRGPRCTPSPLVPTACR